MSQTALKKPAALSLKDPSLFRQQCYINGQWVDADSGKTIDVTNPATGEVLGTISEPGLHFLWAKLGIKAALIPLFGKVHHVDLRLDQEYLRSQPVNSEEGAPMGIGIWYEMTIADPGALSLHYRGSVRRRAGCARDQSRLASRTGDIARKGRNRLLDTSRLGSPCDNSGRTVDQLGQTKNSGPHG